MLRGEAPAGLVFGDGYPSEFSREVIDIFVGERADEADGFTPWHYSYDAVGNRTSITYAGGSDDVDYEYDEAGSRGVNTSIPQVLDDEAFHYVYGLGRIAQASADTHYYLTDGLGSTMALGDTMSSSWSQSDSHQGALALGRAAGDWESRERISASSSVA